MTEKGPVLVTGGCGYIGTHTIVCLLEQGYDVVVVDNLINASEISLDKVAEIANLTDEERTKRLVFYNVDLCDKDALRVVFEKSPTFSSCIHFAGLKVRTVNGRGKRKCHNVLRPHYTFLNCFFFFIQTLPNIIQTIGRR